MRVLIRIFTAPLEDSAPRHSCPDNRGGGRCPAPVLLGAPRKCLADGLRLAARNGWDRNVGAAAAERAIAKGRDDVNPRNDGWRERLLGKRLVSRKSEEDGCRGRRRDDAARSQVGCPQSGGRAKKHHG